MRSILLFTVLIVALSGCSKEKRFSNKLMKGEVWEVRQLTIDDSNAGVHGLWNVTDNVDIYDSVPRVQWVINAQDAVFEWQFQDKGKTFRLNYLQQCEECTGNLMDSLDYLVYALSGSYNVDRHTRKKMVFSSTATLGYPDKKVIISLERR
jgi:hypothetical protein